MTPHLRESFYEENYNFSILIVDDSKFFNDALKKALIDDGHFIAQAFTLEEAKTRVLQEEFDYILLDLILPDGHGIDLVETVDDDVRKKIIILSASESQNTMKKFMHYNIINYISKDNSFHFILQDVKNNIYAIAFNQHINVLIVDDAKTARMHMKLILEPRGYKIFEAASAEEGLQILDNVEVDLFLVDFSLGGMSGSDMLVKVKHDPLYLHTPFILVSGNEVEDAIADVIRRGGNDFIKKPFTKDELVLKCNLHVKNYINIQKTIDHERSLEKTVEQLRYSEHHKSLFLANMSHEIRTPLNAILGFVELLSETEEDEQKLEYFKTIKSSGALLLNIINDILDFSKIESNKLNIFIEVFSIEELKNSINSIFKNVSEESKINFSFSIEKDVPKYLKSDFLRIQQILINLVSNAFKFTHADGSVMVKLSTSEEKKCIRFEVQDTGIGISPENHEKVFSMFTQAEISTTKKYGGTGLGLSISSRLSELLGGKIDLQSEVGKGSTFSFSIPVIAYDESEIPSEVFRVDIDLKKLKNIDKLLLVEDNEANQKYMDLLLSKLDIKYDLASNGIEAVELFKNNSYSIVLMDENMPQMNGIEATAKIRRFEQEKDSVQTPIVALTANSLAGDRERFLAAGMTDYATKPVNKKTLVHIFMKYFNF